MKISQTTGQLLLMVWLLLQHNDFAGQGLHEGLRATAKAENEVDGGLLLVGLLFASEGETLLIRGVVFRVLNFDSQERCVATRSARRQRLPSSWLCFAGCRHGG